jgi:hypothetical protein
MSCETVSTLLLEMPAEVPADAQAHLKGCVECSALARELALVRDLTAIPKPSPAVRGRLASMGPAVRFSLDEGRRRQGLWRRGLSLAVAAGLGALVATLALGTTAAPTAPLASETGWDVPFAADEGMAGINDDEMFDEVSWPSDVNDEGEL